MKTKSLFLSLFILISGLFLNSINTENVSKLFYHSGAQTEQMGKTVDGDGCYIYEEVVINGKIYIYVYDCDGNLIEVSVVEE